MTEAIVRTRARRTSLSRFGASAPVNKGDVVWDRRLSATFEGVPGDQVLGPAFDYTHCRIDFKQAAEGEVRAPATAEAAEFVLGYPDNIQAIGFLEHIKLLHYVGVQSELELVRNLRRRASTSTLQEAAQ